MEKLLQKDDMILHYDLIIESIALSENTDEYNVVQAMINSYRRKYPTLCVNADELERKMTAKITADAYLKGKLLCAN